MGVLYRRGVFGVFWHDVPFLVWGVGFLWGCCTGEEFWGCFGMMCPFLSGEWVFCGGVVLEGVFWGILA